MLTFMLQYITFYHAGNYFVFPPLLKVFDNYAVTVMIGGEPYTLGLFDTAGKYLLKYLISILFLCGPETI